MKVPDCEYRRRLWEHETCGAIDFHAWWGAHLWAHEGLKTKALKKVRGKIRKRMDKC